MDTQPPHVSAEGRTAVAAASTLFTNSSWSQSTLDAVLDEVARASAQSAAAPSAAAPAVAAPSAAADYDPQRMTDLIRAYSRLLEVPSAQLAAEQPVDATDAWVQSASLHTQTPAFFESARELEAAVEGDVPVERLVTLARDIILDFPGTREAFGPGIEAMFSENNLARGFELLGIQQGQRASEALGGLVPLTSAASNQA
jgi:hypothetical protein